MRSPFRRTRPRVLVAWALAAFALPVAAQDRAAGRVLDARFAPVAGAVIGIRFDRAGDPLRSTADVLAEPAATTGPDGRFEVALDAGPADATPMIVLGARGLATVEVPAREDVGDVVLPAGVTLVGTVRDADGAVLEGVEVRVEDALRDVAPLRSMPRAPTRPRVVAHTDARGLFRASGALGIAASVQCAEPGYATATLAPVAFGDPIVVEMRRTGFVRGRLLDADGRPVQAPLVVRGPGGRTAAPVIVRTAADGAFEIGLAREGEIRIEASVVVDGEVQSVSHGPVPGPVGGLVLTLERPEPDAEGGRAPLVVSAVAVESGEPITDFEAAIAWSRNAESMPWEFLQRQMKGRRRAGPDGRARLPAPEDREPTTGVAFVGAPGRAWTRVDRVEWREDTVDRPVVVELPAESVVRGRVVDPATGAGVPGVRVGWVPDSAGRARYLRIRDRLSNALGEAATGPDGSFELARLPGRAVELLAVAPGRPQIDALPLELAAGAVVEGVTIGAPRGCTLRAQVRGLDGRAGLRAAVRALQIDPRVYVGNQPPVEVDLSDDGALEVPALGPGFYVLELVVPGSARGGVELRLPVETFRVRTSRTEVRVDVDVSADRPATIAGRLDVVGGALPRVRLAVVAEDEVRQRFVNPSYTSGSLALPDPDGSFSLTVPPGVHRLRVFDVASGVEVARVGDLRVEPAGVLDVAVRVEVVPVLVTMRPEREGAVARADRLEVLVAWPDPSGGSAARLAASGNDSGIGLDVSHRPREVELFVPPIATVLRLWQRIETEGGDDAEKRPSLPVAERELTPEPGARVEVELLVPSGG